MRFLLDTNVISETAKPEPDTNVLTWLAEVDEDRVYLSVASMAEIRLVVELLPESRRRNQLSAWLTHDLPLRFAGRILDVDQTTAEAWGLVLAHARRTGTPVGTMDALFAATARVYSFDTRDPERARLSAP